MRPMIRRRTLTCGIVFGFLCLGRVDHAAVRAESPSPSGAVQEPFDPGAPGTDRFPSDAKHRERDHPRFAFKVGHRIMKIVVPGSLQENRHVDVHLWYPADDRDYFDAPLTEYTSALNGARLEPTLWDPLAWRVASSSAHEGPSILRRGPKHPVIIFSHGNTNMPIDYAFTLEDIASAGFIVAAPTHVNNSQDDVRMDFANAQAVKAGFRPPFSCLDDRPSPCSRLQVPLNMADRVRDITYTLDALPAEFENCVDLDRVGAFGHSRGTVTALTAAGGSTVWGVFPEPRIKAVMGMAIGAPAITFSANISSITQPTLLVAGALDSTSPPSVSEAAFNLLASAEKEFVIIPNAVHRTFDSTFCRQMQTSAAIAQGNSRALLDRHTASGILTAALSGTAMDYCGFETFSTPVDVRPIVTALTGFVITETNAPTTLENGSRMLTTDQVRALVGEMAIRFFGDVIGRPDSHGHQCDEREADEWQGCDPISISAPK